MCTCAGNRGFDKVAWNIEQPLNGGEDSVRLTYTSPDGEEVRVRAHPR